MERDVVDRAYDEPRSVTQLERNGYFCVDAAGSPAIPPQRLPGAPLVLNRCAPLKDVFGGKKRKSAESSSDEESDDEVGDCWDVGVDVCGMDQEQHWFMGWEELCAQGYSLTKYEHSGRGHCSKSSDDGRVGRLGSRTLIRRFVLGD